jgi:hypothetical protein
MDNIPRELTTVQDCPLNHRSEFGREASTWKGEGQVTDHFSGRR